MHFSFTSTLIALYSLISNPLEGAYGPLLTSHSKDRAFRQTFSNESKFTRQKGGQEALFS